MKEANRETTLCLAAAHALVRLDEGTVVGDPMERTTLQALGWAIGKGDTVTAEASGSHKTSLVIRRRFQFSSALKRMSTLTAFGGSSGQKRGTLAAVKGAPETIKKMLINAPAWYDETYKWYTRRGSRVLALGMKELEVMSNDKVGIRHI